MQLSIIEAIEILKSDSENLKRVMEYYGVNISNNKSKCPFHSDNHPSLSIKGGRYKCFTNTCGASGDLIDFIRYKESCNVLESVKKAIEILGLNYTIEKTKLDKLKEWIEKNNATWYADENFKLEDVYFYNDKDDQPVLARIKYKNLDTGKKQFSQANIVDCGDYYKLDYKTEKINLIYNMPRVLKSIRENKEIFLVEGEKDALNLQRIGFTATTCREITSVSNNVLSPLINSKLVIIHDNDEAGRKHLANIKKKIMPITKSFKVPFIKEIHLKEDTKQDISDFIESKFNEGLTSKDIRSLIIDIVERTLDQNNVYELQQDEKGVYKTFIKEIEGEQIETKIYLTNFNVISLVRVENIDTDEEIVEFIIKNNLNEIRKIKARSNKLFLDVKSFNSFMNMGFFFDGKPKDLNMFKAWVNKYFLIEKRNEYLLTGIREIENKKMLITPNGALMKNGDIDLNYKADNHITLVNFNDTKRLDKETATELSKHLFNWNSEKNCYNVIGSLVANMLNSIYRECNGINVHVTSYVGESGSGKSFTIDNITRPLLGLDNDTMVFSSIMPHGLLRALNDTYMPTIIDEVKPSQSGEFKRQLLSNTIRSITGESTVIKGTQNQGFKTYKYNSSLIIAGEETLDETALKNRCNIIWFSCNEMTEDNIKNGGYFLTKEGREAMKSLGMEIYIHILNKWDGEKLLKTIDIIENTYKNESKLHPRIQATFNNTMLGIVVLQSVLSSICGDKINFKPLEEIARLIYQNLKENVLDGEYATKQIYDEVLEAIDDLASGIGQYTIVEGVHYKQDSLYLKFDFKSIYPVLESYYKSRGKILKLDLKTFTGMITKSKYIEGESKDYYKVVKLDGKSRRCYFLSKEKLKGLDMQTLVPNNEIEWEEI